jgi:hypothetical protein
MALPTYVATVNQALTNSPATVVGASYDLPAQAGSGNKVQQFRTKVRYSGVTRAEELSLYEIVDSEVYREARRVPAFIYDDAPKTMRNLTATGDAQVTAAGLLLGGVNHGRGLSDGAYIPHYPTRPFRSGPLSLSNGGAIRSRFTCAAIGTQMTVCSLWGDGLNAGELSHIGPFVGADGKVSFAWQETVRGIKALTGTTVLTAGVQCIADVQYDKDAQIISLYVNGVREAQMTGVADITASTSDFQIGFNSGATVIDNLFHGTIREICVTETLPVPGNGASYAPPAYPLPDDAGELCHYTFQDMIVADEGVGSNLVTAYTIWRDLPAEATTLTWSAVNTTRAGGTLVYVAVEQQEVTATGGSTEFAVSNVAPIIDNGGGVGPKSGDVANPQIAYDAATGTYFINYSGWNGSRWSMFIARAAPGAPITGPYVDSVQNPLMDPADYTGTYPDDYITSNGSVLARLVALANKYKHWYQVTLFATQIDMAESTLTDGTFSPFVVTGTAILNTENDEAIVADPCIRERQGGGYVGYYVAGHATDLQQRHITRCESDDGSLLTHRRILFGGLPYLSYSMGEPSGAYEPGGTVEHVLFDSSSSLGTGNQPDRRICEAVSDDRWATICFTPNRIPFGGTDKEQMVFDADIHYDQRTKSWIVAFAGSNTKTGDQGGNFKIFMYQTGFAPAFAPTQSATTNYGLPSRPRKGFKNGRPIRRGLATVRY